MRALCGAIITAGALIGLGLTAMGIGTRYTDGARCTARTAADPRPAVPDGPAADLHPGVPDRAAVVGLGIAFVGLAYHHLRRDREYQWEKERYQRTAV